jgi:hypothetical protein
VQDLKHNPKKEKNAHCQYDHNKKMFCHSVYLPGSEFVLSASGVVRSARADPMVLK